MNITKALRAIAVICVVGAVSMAMAQDAKTFKTATDSMNTMPEWFVVEPAQKYTVKNLTAGMSAQYTGKQLHAGLKVTVKGGAALRLTIE